MKRLAVLLFFGAFCILGSFLADCTYAITPPPPVAPTLASVIIEIKPATLRADKVTPFAASEIKEHRLYFTQLSAYITVPAPTLTYTWIVPSGQCFRPSDSVAGTTVDTGGLESEASATVTVAAERCTGKYPAGKPAVLITNGS